MHLFTINSPHSRILLMIRSATRKISLATVTPTTMASARPNSPPLSTIMFRIRPVLPDSMIPLAEATFRQPKMILSPQPVPPNRPLRIRLAIKRVPQRSHQMWVIILCLNFLSKTTKDMVNIQMPFSSRIRMISEVIRSRFCTHQHLLVRH